MSNYIIAIIGKPNVGKSTLFNRIAGKKQAIVYDEPGVTRDRHYQECEWSGKNFTLIDTGGFLPKSNNIFEKAIKEQVKIAVEESDAIIFLLDFETGINSIDEEIAKFLRKSQKQIYVTVNKMDNEKRENLIGEFYKLGFNEIQFISSISGRRVGDFLDKIISNIPINNNELQNVKLKLAIIGKPNVGKSSLTNSLLGKSRNIVTPIPGTTRDSIDSILKINKEEIVLIDTAGLRKKSKTKEDIEFYSTLRTIKSIERADVAIVVIDAQESLNKQDLQIIEGVVEKKKGVIIAVNKWDLIEKDTMTAVYYEKFLKRKLKEFDYIQIIFISALEKQRIFKLIEIAKSIRKERRKKISTNKLNEVFEEIFFHTPPSSKRGKEIRIKYVMQVETEFPVFVFFVNEPDFIEDNYKKFLERNIRKHFGFNGVPLTLQFRKK